ncbi:MAG: 50S ribosomal protein L13 [Candidatus Woesearchaeota archaeon]|jgi:large subunit ribosomal protein L13|nr:50S ribosomal protein L13 [Candidatus Woesearchaeota archaeon]MDP7457402.1 50S ribosomal protein L13 [Candidatus Woesearchaeota archaeon]
MIIDATNLVLGRLATFAAKKALLGEKVDIVNCDKAVVTGNKTMIFDRYDQMAKRGTATTGQFIKRAPHEIVKRAIRNMLPYKKPRGTEAFKSIKAHVGIPETFKEQKAESIDYANVKKMSNVKYITIADVSKFLGGKV